MRRRQGTALPDHRRAPRNRLIGASRHFPSGCTSSAVPACGPSAASRAAAAPGSDANPASRKPVNREAIRHYPRSLANPAVEVLALARRDFENPRSTSSRRLRGLSCHSAAASRCLKSDHNGSCRGKVESRDLAASCTPCRKLIHPDCRSAHRMSQRVPFGGTSEERPPAAAATARAEKGRPESQIVR